MPSRSYPPKKRLPKPSSFYSPYSYPVDGKGSDAFREYEIPKVSYLPPRGFSTSGSRANDKRAQAIREGYYERARSEIENEKRSSPSENGKGSGNRSDYFPIDVEMMNNKGGSVEDVLKVLNYQVPVWGSNKRPKIVNQFIRNTANENLSPYVSYAAQTVAGFAYDNYVAPVVDRLRVSFNNARDDSFGFLGKNVLDALNFNSDSKSSRGGRSPIF